MTTSLKILIAVSAALFVASLTDVGSAIAWGFLKPLSFLLFIAFYIGQLLHKEVVKYDEEQRLRLALAKAESTSPAASQSVTSRSQTSHGSATMAVAH